MYDIHLVRAYLQIKKAYALANRSQGKLDAPVCRAILQASDELLSHKQEIAFVPESVPSISGIAINTSINKAIASRAKEILGDPAFEAISPDNHVNLNQEIKTLFHLAARLSILLATAELEQHLLRLERVLLRESLSLARVLKVNFTVTDQSTTAEWGKRLNVFAASVETVLKRLKEAKHTLADAENTTDQKSSSSHAIKEISGDIRILLPMHLHELTNFRLKMPDDAEQNSIWQNTFIISDFSLIASALKDLALILSKLASVAKIVNSITLGNSPDSGNMKKAIDLLADGIKMSASQAMAQTLAFTFLSQSEQLEGDLLMPLLSENLLQTINTLKTAVDVFAEKALLSA